MPPAVCPNCGATVPPNAQACPECGSDDQTGWADGAETGGLDLPDDEFSYDEYVRREFGREGPVPRGLHWFWWFVALVLVALMLAWFA